MVPADWHGGRAAVDPDRICPSVPDTPRPGAALQEPPPRVQGRRAAPRLPLCAGCRCNDAAFCGAGYDRRRPLQHRLRRGHAWLHLVSSIFGAVNHSPKFNPPTSRRSRATATSISPAPNSAGCARPASRPRSRRRPTPGRNTSAITPARANARPDHVRHYSATGYAGPQPVRHHPGNGQRLGERMVPLSFAAPLRPHSHIFHRRCRLPHPCTEMFNLEHRCAQA